MMAKLKIKKNSMGYEVTIKLQNRELINENEMAFFANRLTKGFVNPIVENSRKLRFDIPGSESLYMFLKSGIKTEDIFIIIVQFLEMIKKIETMKLYLCNVILDLNCVFYKLSTKEVQFIYQPLINTNFRINFFDFMNSVIYSAVFKPGEDTGLIGSFCQLLSGMERLDTDKINSFIMNNIPYVLSNNQSQKISGVLFAKKETVPKDKVPNKDYSTQSSNYESGNSFNPVSSFNQPLNDAQKIQPPKTNVENNQNIQENHIEEPIVKSSMTPKNIQTPLDDRIDVAVTAENNFSGADNYTDTVLLDDEGTVLLDDNEGTILLNENITIAALTRKRTGERTIIDKNIFHIGSSKNLVDYIVTENRAVSRTHADIITKGNKYYIYDEKSTNGTFINGSLIEKKKEYEIHSGDTIKLADEEFIFEIE